MVTDEMVDAAVAELESQGWRVRACEGTVRDALEAAERVRLRQSGVRVCPYCGTRLWASGMGMHRKHCPSRPQTALSG